MKEFVLHQSQLLKAQLELPVTWRAASADEVPQIGDLSFEQGHLAAYDGERWQYFDFSQTLTSLRPSPKGLVGEPLARALGLTKNRPTRIIDATCGSAKDALQVWRWGMQVVAYERNEIVYALLWDALRRHPLPNFSLQFADAAQQNFQRDDFVMYDPMFAMPEKKKALPRKEMQLFKNVVGPDEDQQDLLEQLLTSGAGRVVIKRPLKLAAQPTPNHSFPGKTIRYDVYLA